MSQTSNLKVIGEQTMSCGGCERNVQATLSDLAGVQTVKANHQTQMITVDFSPNDTDLSKITAELDSIGYQVEAV